MGYFLATSDGLDVGNKTPETDRNGESLYEHLGLLLEISDDLPFGVIKDGNGSHYNWEIQLQMVDLHCHVSLPDIW